MRFDQQRAATAAPRETIAGLTIRYFLRHAKESAVLTAVRICFDSRLASALPQKSARIDGAKTSLPRACQLA